MCWELVCWGKHVCNAVIRPFDWSYIVQKQVMGDRVAETETPVTLLQDTAPSKLFDFYGKMFKLLKMTQNRG